MKKSERLKTVLRVEELAEQRQLLSLNKSRQQLEKQRDLLTQLKNYRNDYTQINHTTQGVRELQNASNFMLDLDQAVESQQRTEQGSYEQWQLNNTRWAQLRARREAVMRLHEEYKAVEIKAEENRNDQDNTEVWLAAKYYKN